MYNQPLVVTNCFVCYTVPIADLRIGTVIAKFAIKYTGEEMRNVCH